MIPKRLVLAVLAVGVAAGLALGQSSGKYKITLVAPIEGAAVAADQVRVVLTPNTTALGDDRTQIDVFLDGQQKGAIKATETDFRVEGVKPGPHKLVLIARNPVTDEQFDRREISFTATGDGSGSTTGAKVTGEVDRSVGAHVPPAVNSTERQHSYTATDSTQSAPSDVPVSSETSRSSSSTSSDSRYASSSDNRSSSSSTAMGSNPPASTSSYSSSTTTASDTVARKGERLPKTASSDALLAAAGVALLLTGAVLRRNG